MFSTENSSKKDDRNTLNCHQINGLIWRSFQQASYLRISSTNDSYFIYRL